MGYKDYLKENTDLKEMTFAVTILDFFKEASKKFSEMDIKKWAKNSIKNKELDDLLKKMEINKLDIKRRLFKDLPKVFV